MARDSVTLAQLRHEKRRELRDVRTAIQNREAGLERDRETEARILAELDTIDAEWAQQGEAIRAIGSDREMAEPEIVEPEQPLSPIEANLARLNEAFDRAVEPNGDAGFPQF